jgi:predicted RNase H-like HicB family nuclease
MKTKPTKTYECEVILCPEDEGGYSAHAVNLAGVVSEGETIDEALASFTDAFKETLAYYLQSGTPIPWRTGDPEFFASMANTIQRRIAEDV